MAVEVLLRRSIESLGKVGEVVRVRPGYARNYLLPEGLAVLPTTENLRLVEKDKVAEAKVEAERAKERADLIAKLEGVNVTLEAKANPEGHLFGSVGPKQIADALVAKGFPIAERNVRMEPLKAIGEHEVKLHLAADAELTIKVWIVEEISGDMAASIARTEKADRADAAERHAKAEQGAKDQAAAPKAQQAPVKAPQAPAKPEKLSREEKAAQTPKEQKAAARAEQTAAKAEKAARAEKAEQSPARVAHSAAKAEKAARADKGKGPRK
jgi:large subunit ribosomal protein L9